MQTKYRKNIRLKKYDYSANGYYFVTICCSCRAKLCQKYQEIIEKNLHNFNKCEGVGLDYYKLMPNHLHFILVLEEAKLPLCRYIQDFKSKTTLRIKKNGFIGKRFWQPNYYEHVIRCERALAKIREYIENNPEKERIDFENFYK
ncbi:MAG: transposase [Elusimicrobia bacterium]|nr:transposase [Elusimicrobiota bacterium]